MTSASVEPLLKVCLLCSSVAERMNTCKTCIEQLNVKSYYCSKTCQERHWPTHKTWHKQNEMVKMLGNLSMQLNPSTTKSTSDSFANGENGETQLMLKSFHGDLKGVLQLLDNGADTLKVDNQGLTALYYAINRAHKPIVHALLNRGPPELMFKVPPGIQGQTCLHDACARGVVQLVEMLIEAGGDKLLYATSSNEGASCLHVACQCGHAQVVRTLLLRGGDRLLRMTSKDGSTCLFIASGAGRLETVKLLIEAGGESLVHMARPDGYSCLKIACYAGHADIADALVLVGGERLLYATTPNGHGPLSVACQMGHQEVVRTLLARGGAALVRRTPLCLILVSITGNAAIARLLLDAGGDDLLAVVDPNGSSALDVAAQHGHADLVRAILSRPAGRALTTRLRPFDHRPSALMAASFNGHVEVVRLLPERAQAPIRLLTSKETES